MNIALVVRDMALAAGLELEGLLAGDLSGRMGKRGIYGGRWRFAALF